MLNNLNKNFTILAAIAVLFIVLFFPIRGSSDDNLLSREYWLLDPFKYIDRNSREKARLENCVSRLGIIDSIKLISKQNYNAIEIEVTNVLDFAITGLVVQPIDERLRAADLDGRSSIEFDPIHPQGKLIYSEEIQKLPAGMSDGTRIEAVAWDVTNSEERQLVQYVFWSQWPTISSEADLAELEKTLCR